MEDGRDFELLFLYFAIDSKPNLPPTDLSQTDQIMRVSIGVCGVVGLEGPDLGSLHSKMRYKKATGNVKGRHETSTRSIWIVGLFKTNPTHMAAQLSQTHKHKQNILSLRSNMMPSETKAGWKAPSSDSFPHTWPLDYSCYLQFNPVILLAQHS